MKWFTKLIFCTLKRPKHVLDKHSREIYTYNGEPISFNNEFLNEQDTYWKCRVCGEEFDNDKGK